MKSLLRASFWAAFTVASVATAASCGDSETPNPVSTATSTGGAGGSGGSGAAGGNVTVGSGGMGAGGMSGTGGMGGEGGIQIPKLTSPVQAVYDPYGVVHIHGKTDDDCFAALGYFHAANRFFFMDFVRNLVRGSLGSLVKGGDLVMQQDYQNRRFFTTKTGDPLEQALYDQASPTVQGHMDAYTRGVNAWIGDMRANRNGATLTVEYQFSLIVQSAIRDWESADSAAVGLYVLNDLSNDSSEELGAGAALPLFAPALAADLFSPAPVFDAFTVPASNQPAPTFAPPVAPAVQARLAPHRALLENAAQNTRLLAGRGKTPRHIDERGSNNWVVGPGRTSGGNALLANDPHLLLGNPSIWFPVELDAKSNGGTGDYHVAGGTFPGLPSIMIGQNESIAWGVTTAYYDLDDVYLETLTSDNASVNFNGSTVPLLSKTYKFTDASTSSTVSQTFKWVPHHGPIVSEDDTAHTAVSIRWRGHDGGQDLDAFFGIAKATSLATAKAALGVASSANQNFVVMDTQGQIGWFPYSKVPTRPWASLTLPPWLPLPGDGSAEWGDPVPFASLPQLENPPLGAIATANNDMTGASALPDPTKGQTAIQSAYKADGTREQRILDLLAAGANTHTTSTFSAMQGDTYSLYGSFVVPAVLAAAATTTLTPAEQAVVDALTPWQYTCPTGLAGNDPVNSGKSTDPTESQESIGCTAFHVTFDAIVEQALGDEVAAAAAADPTLGLSLDGGFGIQLVARALKDPSSLTSGALLWDDVTTPATTETETDILVRALARAGDVLGAISATPDDWRWGRVHTVTLRSVFDNFGITTYNYGPYAERGGLFTVSVGDPIHSALATPAAIPDFGVESGPSIRLIMEAKPTGPTMQFQLPGGEDLHHESQFYNNLLPSWLANQPMDFAFGPNAVPNPAVTVEVFPQP